MQAPHGAGRYRIDPYLEKASILRIRIGPVSGHAQRTSDASINVTTFRTQMCSLSAHAPEHRTTGPWATDKSWTCFDELSWNQSSGELYLRLFERIAQNVEVFQREASPNGDAGERVVGDVAGDAGDFREEI